MSATPYNTVEKVKEINIPAWSTIWTGSGGCPDRSLFYSGQTALPPSGQTKYYIPYHVVSYKDTRNLKGLRAGGNPPYYHTPYSIGTYKTRNHLLRRDYAASPRQYKYQQYGTVDPLPGGGCQANISSVVEVMGELIWRDVVDDDQYAWNYTISNIVQADVDNARRAVEADVSSAALTQFDLLTEVAEMREMPRLVGSITKDITNIFRGLNSRFSTSDMRTAFRMTPSGLIRGPSRALRRLGQEWMRYRYGIMPMIHSYNDVVKTISRGKDVTTRRSAVVAARPTGVSLPPSTSKFKWTETTGEITIRGNVFQHFEWQDLARLSGIGVNLLATAWELIPYSFVADWFVNVGDFITRTTSHSYARVLNASISLRTRTTLKRWMHYPREDQTIYSQVTLPTNWVGSAPPTPPPYVYQRPEESQIHYEFETDAYERWPINVYGAQLSFNPNINWKRGMDLAAMANNLLSGLINRFR